jgi:hypothetical protein
MSKSIGLLLVGVGVGVAAYALAPRDVSGPTPAAPARPVYSKPAPPADAAPSPTIWAIAPKITPESALIVIAAAPKPAPMKRLDLADLPQRIAIGRGGDDVRPAADKMQLGRDIQRHLKRIGCYAGEMNGVWSPATRRAMKAYLDNVNASLPVEEPQLALLAILETQDSLACGTPCGPDVARTADGRCRTATSFAQEARAPLTPVGGSAAGPLDLAATTPLEGQMSLAGPKDPAILPPAAGSGRPNHASEQPHPQKPARASKKFGHPAWAFSYNPN